jgi:hypothetical protein
MEKQLYTIPEATQALVDVARLVSVAQKLKTSAGVVGGNDVLTATSLLSNCTLVGNPSEYQVMKNSTLVGHLVKGVSVDYIFYEGAVKSSAKRVHYMVYGDPAYDILVLNPSISYEKIGDKVFVSNTTKLNGYPFYDAPPCRQVVIKGQHFSVTDKDGMAVSLIYLGADGGYSQLGSSPDMVSLSKTATDADYIWTLEDQLDVDQETINLQVVYRVKNETDVFRLTLNSLFQ